METAPLKTFATSARTELIREVTARIKAVLAQGSPERVEQPRTVAALERAVAIAGGGDKGKAHVADKVAYTWFNRIVALRFMDANGYTGIGVISPALDQVGQPEVLAAAKRGQVDKDVVSKHANLATITGLLNDTRQPRRGVDAQAEAYALLLADYCRFWNKALPFIFERQGDFTELLIPANLLVENSVLNRAVKVLTTDVCQDVEVIGWLYQFYIAERKDQVFAGFKKNKKAGADEIPSATQLFTPHWIVRYLVENSLGRLWMLNRPSSGLVHQMDYYIAPVDEETDYLKIAKPEELKVIDPACGSGHMLTYAFDLLYAIYAEEGYTPSEIPGLILANNLYGTEIDPRAGALAAFALTMKAVAKRKLFLKNPVEPNICVIDPISFSPDELDYLVTTDGDRHAEEAFWNQFEQADTQGSLIRADPDLTARLAAHLDGLDDGGDLYRSDALWCARSVIAQAKFLVPRYAVAVANPPYMGSSNMDAVTAGFAKSEYSLAKTDLYAMFIERCLAFVVPNGLVAMVTQDSWMFLGAYAKYRDWLLHSGSLLTLAHLGTAAFDTIGGEVVSTVAFTLKGAPVGAGQSVFIRAIEEVGGAKAHVLRSASRGEGTGRVWIRAIRDFFSVPNTPVIYWATNDEVAALCQGPHLSDLIQAREGLTTGSNDTFLRRWFEVSIGRIGFDLTATEDAVRGGQRWFPYQKGGSSRRWYGYFDFVVDWEGDGARQKQNVDPVTGRVRSHNYNGAYGFRRGFTWSSISGDGFAVRHVDGGFMFDTKGPMAFANREDELLVIEGFLNSSTATRFLRLLAPRLDFKLGHVLSLPIRITESAQVTDLVKQCVNLVQEDWDTSELSSNFAGSPMVGTSAGVADAIDAWFDRVDAAQGTLAKAEEELDSIFGEAYGSSGHAVGRRSELAASAVRVREAAEDLVSYAVGCMFGRYSLDEPGLVLADQGSTVQDYLARVPLPTFTPDSDNVIPVVEGDWFEDDIVGLFRQFLRAAFGDRNFEENLRFITEALGVRSLRDYFITKAGRSKFYDDHVQRYKKRPIYWLFSSPKGSFNALIYTHRYTPSTVSTVLTYLREYVTKLESSLQQAERAQNAKEADRLRKILVELNEYEHDTLYHKASENVTIDLDDGVKANYPKFGVALRKIAGLESSDG
jgi:hypothetical protein